MGHPGCHVSIVTTLAKLARGDTADMQRTPIIYAWGFAVIRTNLKFGNLDLENGTAFLLQFANAYIYSVAQFKPELKTHLFSL